MSDIDHLKQRAEKLSRQFGLIQGQLEVDRVEERLDRIQEAVQRNRDEVDRLKGEAGRLNEDNERLKATLSSLLSAIEESTDQGFVDKLQRLSKKIDELLRAAQAPRAAAEEGERARLSVVTDGGGTPGRSKPAADMRPPASQAPGAFRRDPAGHTR